MISATASPVECSLLRGGQNLADFPEGAFLSGKIVFHFFEIPHRFLIIVSLAARLADSNANGDQNYISTKLNFLRNILDFNIIALADYAVHYLVIRCMCFCFFSPKG